MNEIIEKLRASRVIPVVSMENEADAEPLAAALTEGGLFCAEITFRTAAAQAVICRMKRAFPKMLIAAGTVLSEKQADAAIESGAELIVSPGFNPKVVRYCLNKGYPVIPGVCTPSEIEAAMSEGLRYLKFFPAEASGGVKMINALSAPYRDVRFMPTGGINARNIRDYLDCKAVFACGGSWMVSSELIKNGKFDEITALTKEAVSLL